MRHRDALEAVRRYFTEKLPLRQRDVSEWIVNPSLIIKTCRQTIGWKTCKQARGYIERKLYII